MASILVLSDQGAVTLTGSAGVGVTTVGGATLRALGDAGVVRRLAAVKVDALTTRADLVHALGVQLGAHLPGDETSLRDALHPVTTAILMDDADLAREAVQQVVALSPDVRWILTGRGPVSGAAVPIAPLDDEPFAALCPPGRPRPSSNRPGLARLPPDLDARGDWAQALVDRVPELGNLVELPAGSPGRAELFPSAAVEQVGGRVRARRSFREALGVTPEPTISSLRRAVIATAEHLHRVACDLVIDVDADLRPVLRAAARRLDDVALAALAGAAAARMHIRSFQAAEALDLVRERLAGPRCPPAARALLRWVEADALLIQGSGDAAHEVHLLAAADLHAARATPALIAMACRCAEEWAVRGDPGRSARWLAVAKDEVARRPDRRVLADVSRIHGILATEARRLDDAEARYTEALDLLQGDAEARRERALIQLAIAALRMARGEFERANADLGAVQAEIEGYPSIEAALAWRRTEVALRLGDVEAAVAHLDRADEGFRKLGSLRGLLMVARARGDLFALRGDRHAAIVAWGQALSLCLRTRNLPAVYRVLQRRVAIEQEGSPGRHVDEIQEHLERAEDLLEP